MRLARDAVCWDIVWAGDADGTKQQQHGADMSVEILEARWRSARGLSGGSHKGSTPPERHCPAHLHLHLLCISTVLIVCISIANTRRTPTQLNSAHKTLMHWAIRRLVFYAAKATRNKGHGACVKLRWGGEGDGEYTDTSRWVN
jgi:hypothetical protein